MKLSLPNFKRVSAIAALGLLTGLPIHAQTRTWNIGSGTWSADSGVTNWSGQAWDNSGGTSAVFTGAGGTIVIGDQVFGSNSFPVSLDVGTLDFSGATGTYTLDNATAPINGIGGSGQGVDINISKNGIIGGSSAQIVASSGVVTFAGSGGAGNSPSAGSANISILANNSVVFGANSLGGTATVQNYAGSLVLSGNSNTSTLNVINGGTINASTHTGPAALGNVTNITNPGSPVFGSDFAGTIQTGSGALTVGNLTLSNADPANFGNNNLSFALTNPNDGAGVIPLTPFTPYGIGTPNAAQGSIKIGSGGTLALPTSFDGAVTIAITGANIAGGTYTLIDWTGATATGLAGLNNLGDFVLDTSGATNLSPASRLEIQGTSLVLVAVPEPATVAMPLAACLGLLVLRRRASRMPVAQA